MSIELFGHPMSSYTWKVLIALYEKGVDFTFRQLGPAQPENAARFAALAPFGKFPLLVDGAHVVPEATIIIEHFDLSVGEPRMIPADAARAMEPRLLDRLFDNYVMTPMQAHVNDALRPADRRDPLAVAEAGAALERSYAWLDAHMACREWAAGDGFGLADCAAAPALFYADWVRPIAEEYSSLRAYRTRLLARPSVARCVEQARPYRGLFPIPEAVRD